MVCPESLFPTTPVFPLTFDSPFAIPGDQALSLSYEAPWRGFEAPLLGQSNEAPLQGHPLQGAIAVRISHPRQCWEEATKQLVKLNPSSHNRVNECDLYGDVVARHLAWLSARTAPGVAMTILANLWTYLHEESCRAQDFVDVDSQLDMFFNIAHADVGDRYRDFFIAELLSQAVFNEANGSSREGSEMTLSIIRRCEERMEADSALIAAE
jgi:hypothetical protein